MSPWVRHALAGMGVWKWIGILAIAITIVLTPFTAMGEPAGDGRLPRGDLIRGTL